MKNNKKALSFTMGLFYIQVLIIFIVIEFLFLWSAL